MADTAKQSNGIRACLRLMLSCAILCLLAMHPGPVQAFELLLGSGESGSFSHFVGRQLCRSINTLPEGELRCRTIPDASPVHNLTNLSGGALDLILIDSRLLSDALQETGSFQFLDIDYGNLQALLPVYDTPVMLLVSGDADIHTLPDLQGGKVNFGPPGSLQHEVFEAILAAKSWKPADFSLVEELSNSGSQAAMAFCHGGIQAMLHVGIHPDPGLKRLRRECRARPLNLDDPEIQDMVRKRPSYFRIVLPPERSSFPEHEVRTFGFKTLLVCSSDLDRDTVRRLLSGIEQQQADLREAHPALADFQMQGLDVQQWTIPFHEEAQRFFSEH